MLARSPGAALFSLRVSRFSGILDGDSGTQSIVARNLMDNLPT